jgi:trans-aconitate methyltransferase
MDYELRQLRGRVLSVGSGFGIVDRYVAEINPDVSIEGLEIDAGRVAIARAASPARVTANPGDVTRMTPGSAFDAALAIDVFHHIPDTSHAAVAQSLCASLRAGGVCLVKEMARTPRRQYLWNRLHDRLASGPGPIWCHEPEEMTALLEAAGFEVSSVRRLRRLGLYPQYLVVARRPES